MTTVFKIKVPVWGGRKVGLATYRITDLNEIHILKENADGERMFPNPFYITGEKARSYPIEAVRSNPSIKLYMVPISDLSVEKP